MSADFRNLFPRGARPSEPVVSLVSPTSLFRRTLVAALSIGFLSGGMLSAESVNYAADKVLSTTMVNTSSLRGKPVSLDDIFALVEAQTNLQFYYVSTRIPVDGRMVFESGATMSVAQLFSNVSSLSNVIFQRHDLKIIARGPLPDRECASRTTQPSGVP